MEIRREFPEELWQEILARLPIKSILKFRCVCKSWLSIIDHPHFNSMQFNLSKVNRSKNFLISLEYRYTNILCLRHTSSLRKSGEFFNYYNVRVHGYINGLMLTFWPWEQQFKLWNPSIRKSVLIPYCSFRPTSVIALGFDLSIQDYKILVFDFVVPSMRVYVLGSGSWYTKNINNVVCHTWVFEPDGVYHRGVVYFLVDVKTVKSVKKFVKRSDMKFTRFVSFDCATEEFSVGDLPGFVFDEKGIEQRFLCVFDDSLALMDTSRKGNQIWVMENQGNSNYIWTKRYQISTGIPDIPPTFVVDPKGDILMYEFYRALFRCYDVRSNELKKLLNIARGSSRFMDLYVESLVLSKVLGDKL